MLKMPGAKGATGTGLGTEDAPPRVTTTFAVPAVTPEGRVFHGSCALIWPSEAKYNGAGTPLKVTETSPKEVESGTVLVGSNEAAKPLPKMETTPPGATA